MLSEKIHQTFQKYPQLRILFFFDPEKEFDVEFDSIELNGIRKVKATKNYFNLKVLLNGEWEVDKVFLYLQQPSPQTERDYKNFPLLDLLVANRELRLDDASAFMEEYHLQPHHRSLVTRFMRELQYKTVQEVLKPILSPKQFDEQSLAKGLISAFLKFSRPEDWNILIAKLIILAKEESELTKVTKRIKENGLFEILSTKIDNQFSYKLTGIGRLDLINFLNYIKYNLIIRDIQVSSNTDPYFGLKANRAAVVQNLMIFREQVQSHPRVGSEFKDALEQLGKEIKEETLVFIYGPEAPFIFFTDKMRWEVIRQILPDQAVNPSQVSAKIASIDMQGVQNDSLTLTVEFITHTAEMLSIIAGINSYILDKPEEYVNRYTSIYFKVDLAYRKAITAFTSVDETELPEVSFLRNSYSLLNKKYNEFVEKLNREWLKCLNEIRFDYSKLGCSKQYDFYKKEIKDQTFKVAVIISDAFRFEVGIELMNVLNADMKNQVEIGSILASIPSTTRVGMANLLPGKQFSFDKENIVIDGLSTNLLEDRQRLLEIAKKDSRAVTYDDVMQKSEDENRDLFKSPVVYIFHNVIDATGDKRNAQRRTFTAVIEAVDELKKLVKKLHSSMNVSNVIITADHGFLYNDLEIADKDLQDSTGLDALLSHNRFEIVKDQPKVPLTYNFPVSMTTKLKDDYYVVIPQSVNRFRRQGSGHQYVHGGGSLQELVVPVVYSSRKHKAIASKVKPVLISKPLRVISNILKVTLLQERVISHTEKELAVTVGLYRDLELVSGLVEITMNSTSENPLQRSHNFELTLLPGAKSSTWLKLKVFDKDDMLNPLIEEVAENNTLIEKDF